MIRILLVALSLLLLPPISALAEELHFFVGAGLRQPIDRLAEDFQAKTGHRLVVDYDGSGRLVARITASGQGDLFMPGARHGYEIMQFLGSALEATWRLSTSQLYVLLKRLQQEGLLESRSKTQASRPSKRVFNLTIGGRKAFLDWLAAPVEHVRDFRMEFLCKMFFLDHLSLPGAKDLVYAQIRVLKRLSGKIRGRTDKDETRFMKLVYGFKARSVEGLLSWLIHEARPFAEQGRGPRSRI